MTTVNCLQSPISSSKTLYSPSAARVSASCFSSFCFNRSVGLYESCSVTNSPKQIATNSHLTHQLPQQTLEKTSSHFIESSENSLNDVPLNVSLLATVYRGYNNNTETYFLSKTDAFKKSEYPLRKQEDMSKVLTRPEDFYAKGRISIEDERTLKLAVELTMLNLKRNDPSAPPTVRSKPLLENETQGNVSSSISQSFSTLNNAYGNTTKVILQTQSDVISPNTSLHQNHTIIEGNDISRTNSLTNLSQTLPLISPLISDERSKKSQNMTECVPVPSSEHVAEIVGRQGCKIKALRAKTNTYIKTPVRNEEPVFVVTGRKEDVNRAKLEILSAAEHFTVIRATRRINENGAIHSPSLGDKQQLLGTHKTNNTSCLQTPGQVTVQVRVPYRLVGLVVGTKGNTIKHIQHETQTYIVTPSRDKEPIFEVTGLADNVELARKHIEIHIATRLGSTKNNSIATSASPSSPLTTIRPLIEIESTKSSLNSLNSFNHILKGDLHSEILSSIYKNGICSTLECGHIHANNLNSDEKCYTLPSVNGGLLEDKENPSSFVINGRANNELKCVDFVNNLIDSSSSQFFSRTNFT
ncbi:uncharacterized protein LOC106092725 [Stomoxys calcitrans]|uniref:uncharacterized protein LOC106092725 n=1 Tax=Stomoxys calcitrans TaxID=35570 RepID=UPI0027E2B68E|nr:uncharacterized protein LOC106092725 [Stomoxys calcitrans]